MQNIIIGRYDDPKASGWAGWLEPADRSWIAFVVNAPGEVVFPLGVSGSGVDVEPPKRR